MIRNRSLGWTSAMLALSSLVAAAAPLPVSDDLGPIYLDGPSASGAAHGPIHRRGRFKRNQRRQRKGQR